MSRGSERLALVILHHEAVGLAERTVRLARERHQARESRRA